MGIEFQHTCMLNSLLNKVANRIFTGGKSVGIEWWSHSIVCVLEET
jgi:hypothetical protein